MGWAFSEQAETFYPLLCQDAAGADGSAGCELIATKTIATNVRGFDRSSVVFFKSYLISN